MIITLDGASKFIKCMSIPDNRSGTTLHAKNDKKM